MSTPTISEMREKIESTVGWGELKRLLESHGYGASDFNEKTGLDFEFISSERSEGSGDYDGWTWRWRFGNRFFQVDGCYSSYEGAELDEYDLSRFCEVRQVEKTVTVWEHVK